MINLKKIKKLFNGSYESKIILARIACGIFLIPIALFFINLHLENQGIKNHSQTFNGVAYSSINGEYVEACKAKYYSNSDYLIDYNNCHNLDEKKPFLYIKQEYKSLFSTKYKYHKITKASQEDNYAYFKTEPNKRNYYPFFFFFPIK